jgi:hypothetical protein
MIISDMADPPDWVVDMYTEVDANNGPAVLARFAPGIELQFGARPVVTGVEEARRTLAAVHENFLRVSHSYRNVWQLGDTTVCEFVATYSLPDGRELPLPTLTVLRRDGDGRIAGMRVYMDEGPLRPHL